MLADFNERNGRPHPLVARRAENAPRRAEQLRRKQARLVAQVVDESLIEARAQGVDLGDRNEIIGRIWAHLRLDALKATRPQSQPRHRTRDAVGDVIGLMRSTRSRTRGATRAHRTRTASSRRQPAACRTDDDPPGEPSSPGRSRRARRRAA